MFIPRTLVLCALFAFMPSCFANTSAQQILEWIELKPKMDLPPENYKVTHDDLGRLEPWLVSGLFEELYFPKCRVDNPANSKISFPQILSGSYKEACRKSVC